MSRVGNYSAIGYPVDGGYQAVTFTASAARTAAAAAGAQMQRIVLEATENCHIAFGGSAVDATTSDFYLSSAAGPVMFVIKPGQYVSAIRSTADGTLHVSQVDT